MVFEKVFSTTGTKRKVSYPPLSEKPLLNTVQLSLNSVSVNMNSVSINTPKAALKSVSVNSFEYRIGKYGYIRTNIDSEEGAAGKPGMVTQVVTFR